MAGSACVFLGETTEFPNASSDPLKSKFRLLVQLRDGTGPFSDRTFASIDSVHDFKYVWGTETHRTNSIGLTAVQCREVAALLLEAAEYLESM